MIAFLVVKKEKEFRIVFIFIKGEKEICIEYTNE